MVTFPSSVGVPLSCLLGGRVEWRGVCSAWCPLSWVGCGTLVLFCPPRVVLLLLSVVCCGWGSAVVFITACALLHSVTCGIAL